MSVLKEIQRFFHQDCVEFNDTGEIELVETKPTDCKKVVIKAKDSSLLIVKPDFNDYPFCRVFRPTDEDSITEGLNSQSDYILFIEKDQKIRILIINLKSGDSGEVKKQFLGTQHFLDYFFQRFHLIHKTVTIENCHIHDKFLFWTSSGAYKNAKNLQKIKEVQDGVESRNRDYYDVFCDNAGLYHW